MSRYQQEAMTLCILYSEPPRTEVPPPWLDPGRSWNQHQNWPMLCKNMVKFTWTCYKAARLSLFPRHNNLNRSAGQTCKICGHLFLFLRKFSLFMDNGSTARKPNLHTGPHTGKISAPANIHGVLASRLLTNGRTRLTSSCR